MTRKKMKRTPFLNRTDVIIKQAEQPCICLEKKNRALEGNR
jgi:hypothetical protein